ncbi:MAG: TIGR04013 family B12-binding domain/radical SAM domain-containing protein [Candidatus Hodarchaeota archaeon]
MRQDIALVLYYQKENIYSFNALVGAIETIDELDNVKIYFIQKKLDLFNSLKEICKSFKKIIVAISFFTTQLWEIYDLIKKLKIAFKNKIFLLAGGPHPTGDPLGSLKMGFDLVAVGEGEETLIDILKRFTHNGNISDIKGTAFIDDNNNYHFVGKRPFVDLDKYPPIPLKSIRFGAIEITRGCPYVCYFCQTPSILGSYPRHRSVQSICKIIRFMKQYNKLDIRFITPNAFSYGSSDGKNLNLSELEKLLIEIKKIILPKGRIFLGSFPSEVRPEHVNPQTLDLVLKYAANDNIIIGAQSGSQRILNLCHRGHTVEDIYRAVELTINSKLKANVDFIFGLPNETEEDIDLTIEVMKDLASSGARIHTHSFIPLPNTVFANMSVKRINKKLRVMIQELNSKGIAYGDWKKQERIALKIANYLKSKRIS